MSFTFDDERDCDQRQEAIAEARERRSPADAMASVLMKTWAKDEAEIAKRDAEIAKLRELMRALVGYVRDRNEDFCDLRQRPCRDCSDGVLCPYHAAKAALRGEE